ncbi:MAG: Na+/H+ antiporter subunit E [Syntrophales bacterium]|jgi:multicomponent Na+:H+ antiporter subunit E|nr:Na+/H+ antiporter subunit E [Syntrophales bacterium]MDY0043269.1 Na+/H+ antiporter subunit E [Syntrophales bacterium]
MEVTLLIQATDDAFQVMEKAKMQAVGILDTATRLTSETRTIQERKLKAIFKGAHESQSGFLNFVATFAILIIFWAVLSGKFDAFHMTLGILCSLVIAWLSHDLLFANVRIGDIRVIVQRFLIYIPWHLYQIFLSNFHVAYLALSPRMPIQPEIIRFKTKLESDISWVAFANSITLTPGTVTVDIEGNEFVVHALSKKVADDLNAGEMEDRIAHIFMEADHIYIQDVLDVSRIFSALK